MENPEIPVGNSNGTGHSIQKTSEITAAGWPWSNAYFSLFLAFSADLAVFHITFPSAIRLIS